MNDRERTELAADIAHRVRTFAWQPMPQELFDALGGRGAYFTVPLYLGSSNIVLEMSYEPIGEKKRLEMGFILPNGDRVGRFLWTPA